MKQYRRLERLSRLTSSWQSAPRIPVVQWRFMRTQLEHCLVRVASYPVPSNGLTGIWAIMDALAPTENIYLFEEAAGA